MAWLTHPSFEEICYNKGYLFWNPSALDEEANWGTKIGYTEKGVDFDPGYQTGILKGEEAGEEPIMKIFLGIHGKISVTLKNYNSTMLNRAFPGLVTSTSVKAPGTILPGADLFDSPYTGYLLFVPDKIDYNMCILFQSASPNIIDSVKIRNSHVDPSAFPIVFDAKRKTDDVDGIYYYGPLSGAVLR